MDKVLRLVHENIFSKNAIKEGIINIKLSNRPVIHNCKIKNNSNGVGLHNRAKYFKKVHALRMVKTLCN